MRLEPPRSDRGDGHERGQRTPTGAAVKARGLVTPLALVLLAGGTAAYAYFVDRTTVSDSDRSARRSDVFPSFRVEEVSRLEIVHGGESLVLERDADAGAASPWAMVSPRRERADPSAVDALLRELELATRVREVHDVPEAARNDATGLDAPRARGKVKVGPLEYRFALGGDAPRPEGAAYMRVEGEGTFVVDRSLKVQLLRGADAYRERTLVPYGASGIAKLEVRAASGESFALERQGATFRLVGPGLRASRPVVDSLMTTLADGRAETFLDDAAADRMTATPAFAVTVTPRDGAHERVELRIGGACPGQPEDVVVVRTAPSRVSGCTARSLPEALATTAPALVDASPFFAHADEIEELRLEPVGRAGPRVEVVRRGNGWRERSPEDRDLTSDEADATNMLTLALAEARGSDVHRPAADERFDARARVTVIRTGGQTREVVDVAAPSPDGTTRIRRADDGAVLRVSRAVARRLEPHPVSLRARSVCASAVRGRRGGGDRRHGAYADAAAPRAEERGSLDAARTGGVFRRTRCPWWTLVGTLSHVKADAVDLGGGRRRLRGSDWERGPGAVALTLDVPGDAASATRGHHSRRRGRRRLLRARRGRIPPCSSCLPG